MPAISPTSRPPAPAKILIVDDEPSVLQTLAAILQGAGYALALAGRGAEALAQWRDQAPDLVLLDLLLPDIDGLAVCRVIRAESTVPILVLSALGEEARQVALLDAGADDYLVKPVRRAELLARIRRALARHAAVPAAYTLGSLQIDVARRQVWRGAAVLHLTPIEWALLLLLFQHLEQVVSYRHISITLWPQEPQRATAAIHTVVRQLRQKLDAAALIITVREVGYGLYPPRDAP